MSDLLICSLGMDHKRIAPNCENYKGGSSQCIKQQQPCICVSRSGRDVCRSCNHCTCWLFKSASHRHRALSHAQALPTNHHSPHFIFGVTPCFFQDSKYFSSFIPSLILKLFNSPYIFFPPYQFCAILSLSFLFTTFPVFTHVTCLFSLSQ